MRIRSWAIGGATVAVIAALVVGFLVGHHRCAISASTKEMMSVDDLGDRDDGNVSSEDYEVDIFDVKAEGGVNNTASTDGHGPWLSFDIHSQDASSSCFDGE
jgi:hypothetical protein